MDFAFNASALAAGAVIERGQVIATTQSLGSVVLAPTGGEGRTAVSDYYSEELKLGHAETRVTGRQFVGKDPRSGKDATRFVTWTSVLMKDVSVFDRVQVGEMGATITSTRGFEEGDDHEFDILIWFHDVRIDRRKIDIGIDERLMRMRRYDDLQNFLGSERSAAASVAKRHDAEGDALTRAVRERKPVRVSLVESIKGWESEALATVHVRGLGTFRFGELMLKPGQRRVNLVRVDFGEPRNAHESAALMAEGSTPDGPTGGSMTLGSGEGNGTPIEP